MAAEFDAGRIEAQLDVDRSPFQQGLELAKKQAREFEQNKITATAELDARKAEAQAKAARGRIDETFARDIHASLDLDTGKADAQLALLDQEVKKLKHDSRDAAGSGGMGMLLTAGLALGPALVPVLATAAAGAVGLGTAFAAAGAGALGFGVVAKGAFSDIEKQQKAMLAAEKQYTAATTDKARAQALEKEKAAWDALTPSEQAAAKSLETLESRFHAAEKALQPIVLTALTPWLNTATTAVGFLTPLVTSASHAIGGLGTEAQTALGSPYWQQFFTFLSHEAQPALTSFGETLGNTAHGFAGVLEAFQPMARQVESGLLRMSQSFATWGAHLGGSSSFTSFMSYVQTTGPQIVHTIGDVATAFGRVIAAAAPMGPPLLQIVDLFARLIGDNADLAALGLTIYGWSRIFNSVGGAAGGAAGKLGGFTTAAGALKLSLVAVAVELMDLYGEFQKYGHLADSMIDTAWRQQHSYVAMTTAIDGSTAALDHQSMSWNPNKMLAAGKAADQVSEAQNKLGTNLDFLTNALGVNNDAVILLAQATGVNLTSAYLDTEGQLGSATAAMRLWTSQNLNADATARRFASSTLLMGSYIATDTDKLNAFSDALNLFNMTGLDVVRTQNRVKQSTSAVVDELNRQTKAQDHNAHSLDNSTKTGQQNVDMIGAAVDAIEQNANATYKSELATKGQAKAFTDAKRTLDRQIQSLENQAVKAGVSKSAFDKLLVAMGLIPPKVSTNVTAPGLSSVNSGLQSVLHNLHLIADPTWHLVLTGGPAGAPNPPQTTTQGVDPFNLSGGGLPPTTPSNARASGGPTTAGVTYLVGEHGPEYWTAAANGYVTPNEAVPISLGGQARGGDSAELLAAMSHTNTLLAQQNGLLRAQLAALYAVPAGTADALNGVARSSAHLAHGTVPVY